MNCDWLSCLNIYMPKNNLNPVFMKSVFEENSHQCKLRFMNTLKLPKVKAVLHSRDIISIKEESMGLFAK